MARYIDADKLISHLKDEIEGCKQPLGSRANGKGIAYGTELGLKSAISFAKTLSTEDVVPKSEVDRLVDKWIGEENLTQDAMVLRLIEALRDEAKRYEKYYFNHEYNKLIAEAKQEVAREIFEEIENRAFGFGACFVEMTRTTFDEIKKKYTESEGKV